MSQTLRDSPVGSFEGKIQARNAKEDEEDEPADARRKPERGRYGDGDRNATREHQRVYAKPLPITLTICTCISSDGISLTYPPSLQVLGSVKLNTAVVLTSADDTFAHGWLINTGTAATYLSVMPLPTEPLIDFIMDNRSEQRIESQNSVMVGGEAATKVVSSDVVSPLIEEQEVAVFVPHHASLYRFYLKYYVGDSREPQFVADFQKILNSVQFTD